MDRLVWKWSWCVWLSLFGLPVACDDEGNDDEGDGDEDGEETSTDSSSGEQSSACMTDEDCPMDYECSDAECIYVPPPYWVVGADGTVLRATFGDAELEPAPIDADLRAIACRGELDAWVVGDHGTLLRSADGGLSWNGLDTELQTAIAAVAASEGAVYAAGEAGVLLASADGNAPFTRVPAGIADDITGVATDRTGTRVWLTTVGGSVWLHDADDENVTQQLSTSTALSDVDVAWDASLVVAVGTDGAIWTSEQGDGVWQALDAGIDSDLHAVQVAADGRTIVVVGEAGIIVRVEDGTSEVLDVGDVDLRGLHIHADGSGAVVGDDGTLLVTRDQAHSFAALATGVRRDLLGVDAIGRPHL